MGISSADESAAGPSWHVLVGVWGGARTLLVPMNSAVYEQKELFLHEPRVQ